MVITGEVIIVYLFSVNNIKHHQIQNIILLIAHTNCISVIMLH